MLASLLPKPNSAPSNTQKIRPAVACTVLQIIRFSLSLSLSLISTHYTCTTHTITHNHIYTHTLLLLLLLHPLLPRMHAHTLSHPLRCFELEYSLLCTSSDQLLRLGEGANSIFSTILDTVTGLLTNGHSAGHPQV